MAIFKFVKQAGELMTEGLERAADAASRAADAVFSEGSVQARIEASGLKPRDLALKKLDDDSIKVYAVVGSTDERDELILLVGNTPGVVNVEDAVKVRPPGEAEVTNAPAPKFYTVRAGDSLSAIAQEQLGDANRYMEIYNANRSILSSPDLIEVGQTLRIPRA